MAAPSKIYVGITDGKHYSIVGEGYPNAKEYVSIEAVMLWFDKYKEHCKDNFLAVCILELVEENFRKAYKN